MGDVARERDPEGRFDLVAPPGWSAAPDEEGEGLEVWKEDGVGTLHIVSFARDPHDFADPAEELWAFLEDRGVELEEDEVEDVPLAGGAEMAVCEFLSEDEDAGDALFWMVGVATAPGALVFATYFCTEGDEDAEREAVRQALATLRLSGADTGF